MAEEPKPARNIQDLKARLGKCAKPPAGAPSATPLGLGMRGSTPSSVPPPPVVPGGGPAAGVAPPPFATGRSSRPPAPADPFAAAAQPAVAQGPREVRLIIDEKPIEESESGKRRKSLAVIVGIAGLIAGALAAGAFVSTWSQNQVYKLSVADGKEIYASVQTASETLNKAQRFAKAAVTSARPMAGRPARVDYQAIESLRALKKPFAAEIYSRRNYVRFNPETVDALLEYHANVVDLWRRIESFSARTLAPNRRELLDRAATVAADLAAVDTGCVPSIAGDRVTCGLVYVTIPPAVEGQAPPTTAQVSLRKGGQSAEKTLFLGGDLGETPDQFVIINDLQRSIGVLGESASPFAEYSRDLLEINAILARTIEIQGGLERQLGEIAKLGG